MKYYARFNATDFIITELPTISDSSREVSFSDLEIDFRGKDEALLPIQYQEVKVIQVDSELNESELFTGYVDTVDFPTFTSDDTPFMITLSLLSPYAYASKRTITKSFNNLNLNEAVVEVLAPLINDGFSIETNELSIEKNVGTIFQVETIEKIMNYLANTFDFIWYIDKNKKIYLKDIDESKNSEPVFSITQENRCFMTSVKPTKTIVDYANKINIKNIFMISTINIISGRTNFVKDQEIKFEHPFSISKNVCSRAKSTDSMFWMYDDNSSTQFTIEYNNYIGEIEFSNNIGILGNEEDTSKTLLIMLDDTDKTKVVGFKWNGDTICSTTGIYTNTAILPYNCSYIDPNEINDISSKINTLGIIEKVVDGNGKYFYNNELYVFATSMFKKNSSATNEIKATFKGRINDINFMTILNNLKITNVISIKLDNFKINGTFLITNAVYKYDTQTVEVEIQGRNFNLNENFNDIFRVGLENLSEETKFNMNIFYCKDKETVLSKEIYVDGELVNND